MIRQNAIEKKAYDLWIENRIKQQRHGITLDFEAFTDKMKDIIHEQLRTLEGLSPETDEIIFSFMNYFLTFEMLFYLEIDNSDMARKQLNERMEAELSDPNYVKNTTGFSPRRIL